jgi:hypothetical protein
MGGAVSFGMAKLGSVRKSSGEAVKQVFHDIGIGVLVYRDSRRRMRTIYDAQTFDRPALSDRFPDGRRDVVKAFFLRSECE